ncbi:MAG: chromosomal replication initiator protein DnaA [Verrucomicrobiales bacterium]
MSERLHELWNAVCNNVRQQISPDAYKRWFLPTRLVATSEEFLTVSVPNQIHQFWIESNYATSLQDAIVSLLGTPRQFRFVIEAPNGSRGWVAVNGSPSEVAGGDDVEEGGEGSQGPAPDFVGKSRLGELTAGDQMMRTTNSSGLSPRYLFENFVVGQSNQFAHAAARAVAENPARVYNPLFIHGGTGLGKTHLMQAIGHHIVQHRKKAKVVYVSSEQFTNEFIDALQQGTLAKFRRRYRQADVLLIDDVQFFGGKERSQDEFFHTFNTLFDGHKQIVMTSDRPPGEMAKLEARLVSRFEWGIAAEMQPPDVETRIAILRKKMLLLEVKVPDEIIRFLAERITNNVRRLEGALMRVASFASLSGGTLSIPRVEDLLRDLLQEDARNVVTIDKIQRIVAEHFDVRLADMTSKRRPASIAFPRQIAMSLARDMTRSSYSEIGQAFGGRDHGTVMHACKLVAGRTADDSQLRGTLLLLESRLKQ